jgi:hypothetical protein
MSGRFGPNTELVEGFLAGVGGLTPAQWESVETRAREVTRERLLIWEEAYDLVSGASLGAEDAGFELAALGGARLVTRAASAGAAAALAQRHRLTRGEFDILYAPFAAVLPLAPGVAPQAARAPRNRLLQSLCSAFGRPRQRVAA